MSSDQLFQVLLGVAHQTQPSHNLLVLVALGCIRVDGERPHDITDPVPMRRLAGAGSLQARRVVSSLDVGRATDDAGVGRVQAWLRMMYQAWLLDVDLYVEL